MTASSHALAGGAIGFVITNPVVALPLAFISHFVLDLLPHFGFATPTDRKRHPRLQRTYLLIEAIFPLSFFTTLLFLGAPWLVIAAALISIAPDLIWPYKFFVASKPDSLSTPGQHTREEGLYSYWHKRIQKFESIQGGIVELLFSGVLIWLIALYWM